jgi:hypothetical protein
MGNFKNVGQEWRRKGNPRRVSLPDFVNQELSKVSPYGVYDLSRNTGGVNIGITRSSSTLSPIQKHGKDSRSMLCWMNMRKRQEEKSRTKEWHRSTYRRSHSTENRITE